MASEAFGWYASVFCWLFFTGLGIPPCPEEAGIIYAAGLAGLHPEVRWWGAWIAASLGILAADVVLYGVGRWFGPRLFEHRWVARVVKPERRQRLEKGFHDHGMKILLSARLLPPLRTGVFMIAGAAHFSFWRFLVADAVYLVLGVGAIFLGSTVVIQLIHQLGHWMLFAIAPVAAVALLVWFYRSCRRRELRVCQWPVPTAAEIIEKAPR